MHFCLANQRYKQPVNDINRPFPNRLLLSHSSSYQINNSKKSSGRTPMETCTGIYKNCMDFENYRGAGIVYPMGTHQSGSWTQGEREKEKKREREREREQLTLCAVTDRVNLEHDAQYQHQSSNCQKGHHKDQHQH